RRIPHGLRAPRRLRSGLPGHRGRAPDEGGLVMKKLSILAIMLTAACGGSQKTGGGGGGGTPPPPNIGKTSNLLDQTGPQKVAPKAEISKDARNDYQAAVQFFAENDKNGK